ncbi:GNAT family N-acetyltransferase [Fictibacillus barbaricus]|uniref:GNAT superfamily N-acetyltransferase n=1 Tax=Fictibacillus barbaricus TaxID=182136 RepID=A0ABU1U631_9BACL|nr:GNAT family N-acetyltransferase [Fictibacillus barbaricus]MDR7074930.1 GNAT superfamily N-acetyltransferase [Fictibacillus barbaricus]
MLVIKRFSELSFDEAISLWNESWKHYFSDMTMDLNRFIQKIAGEGISLEDSVAAVYEGKLAGFVLNSFRDIDGKRYVWNGGTAIAPDYRGMGIGKKLIAVCLDIYAHKQVDTARLEAIMGNTAAIKLYEKMGYQTFEELIFLNHDGPVSNFREINNEIKIEEVSMYAIKELSFFEPLTAWQTQFASLKDFTCVIASKNESPAGYGVYKNNYNEKGELSAIILYQCFTDPQLKTDDETTASLLNAAFGPWEVPCKRITLNVPKKDNALNHLLTNSGFTAFVEQVHMTLPIKKETEQKSVKTFSKID